MKFELAYERIYCERICLFTFPEFYLRICLDIRNLCSPSHPVWRPAGRTQPCEPRADPAVLALSTFPFPVAYEAQADPCSAVPSSSLAACHSATQGALAFVAASMMTCLLTVACLLGALPSLLFGVSFIPSSSPPGDVMHRVFSHPAYLCSESELSQPGGLSPGPLCVEQFPSNKGTTFSLPKLVSQLWKFFFQNVFLSVALELFL